MKSLETYDWLEREYYYGRYRYKEAILCRIADNDGKKIFSRIVVKFPHNKIGNWYGVTFAQAQSYIRKNYPGFEMDSLNEHYPEDFDHSIFDLKQDSENES